MHRVFVTLSLAVVVLAVGCQDQLDVPTTGTIVLNVQFDETEPVITTQAVGDGGTGVRVSMSPRFNASSYSSVRATAEGPSTRTSNLVLTDGFWEGEITGLEPGSYTVTVEAFTSGELQEIGSTSGVAVTAGVSSSASVSLRSFAPSLNAIGAPGTIMGFAVSWGAVTGATGYRVEWSKASDFAGARNQTLDSMVTLIAVSDTGTWNVRVRATAPGITGVPSAPRQVTVNAEASGISGDDAGSAPLLGFGTAITQTIGQLNIAPASDEDWFVFDACLADTIIVQTRAATLTVPSGLNTQLALFNTVPTQVASNNDDGITTDSRIEIDLPADDSYGIRVTGVSGTTGHYQIEIDLRAGPNNTGVVCVQPTVNTVTVTPGSFSLDAIGATQQLTAEARDINNNVITGVQYTWDSDDTGVATVDANGLVTSVGNGTANITATSVPLAGTAAEGVSSIPAGRETRENREAETGERPRQRAGGAASAPPAPARVSANQPAGSSAVTVAQAPASIAITPPQDTITFIGGTAQFNATVFDRLAVAIAGAAITWSSDDQAVATVDATGNATAVANGTSNIGASFDTVSTSVELAVIQQATMVSKVGGDNQSGFTGTTLGSPLVVRVEDAGGTGVAGVGVTWTVTGGGGLVSSMNTTTDANGNTQVTWTLGGAAGAQTVDVSAGAGNAVFDATALAGIAWLNPVSGNWNNAANWDAGVVPGPGDNVLIGLDGTYTVTLDISPTVAFMQLGGSMGLQQLDANAQTLTVNGSLSITSTGELLVTNTSVTVDSLLNAGQVELTAGTINANIVSNTGVIQPLVGTFSDINATNGMEHFGGVSFQLNATLAVNTPGFTAHPGSGFTLVNSSELSVTGATASFLGALPVNGEGTVSFDGSTVDVVGGLLIDPTGTLNLTNSTITVDTLDNAGTLSLDNSSITGPVTNSGYLATFSGTNTIDGQIYTLLSSAIEVNDEGTTLSTTRGFTNQGNISLTGVGGGMGDARLEITETGGILVNTGTIDFFTVPGSVIAETIDNQLNINISNTQCCATLGGNVTSGISGFFFIDQNDLIVTGDFSNAGTIQLENGRTLTMANAGDTLSNAGFLLGGGTIDLTSGAGFVSSGAIGVGPAAAPGGVLTIDGDATLTSTSTLQFEIGLLPNVDRLDVTGTVTLDGEIDIIDAGLDRTYGNRYQVMTFGGRISGFSDTGPLDLGGGFYLRQDFTGVDLNLELSVPQVVVTPNSATITQLGGTQQLSAEAQEFDSTPIAGISFTWSSSNPTVADVDATGLVTAMNSGAATITATADGGTAGTAGITVMAASIATVTVTSEGATIDGVGNTFQYGAEVRDSLGNIVTVPVTWTSLNTDVATVDGTGLVTAVGPGQTAIKAQADTASGYGTVTVVVAGLAQANVFADDGSPTGENLQDVWGSERDDIYAVGTNGTVVYWNGASWSLVDIGAGSLSLNAVWGLSPSNVWIGAGTGEVFEYDGITWTQLPAQAGGGVSGIWAQGPNNVWLALPGGNVANWDGTSWTQMATGQVEDLFAIWGSSSFDVWASGRNGALVHYDGATWTPVASGTTQNILDIWGAAGDDIWAVANQDTLLNYDGMNWSTSTTGSGTSFSNIWGLDRQDIYATGSNGLNEEIWHYDGLGWTLIASFSVTVNGTFQGLIGTPNPSLVAVTSGGGILRGYLGANVVVTPADPTIIAPEDAVQLTAAITDGGGNPIPSATVTWTSSNQGIFPVDATGLVSSTVDGLVGTITATAPGGASDATSVTSDWSFTGTVLVSGAGDFADVVTIFPGNVAWDGDEFVRVAGEEPWIDFQSLDSIIFRIPDVPTGTQPIEVFNQGPSDFSQTASLSVVSNFARFVDPLTAPDLSGTGFPTTFFISLEDDPTDPGNDDHYVGLNPGTNSGFKVTLEWQNAADLDVYWTDNVGNCCNGNFDGATFAQPEVTGEVVDAFGDWRLWFNKFDTGTNRTMARVTIVRTNVGTAITAGLFHSCGINIDGGAQCWGANDDGQLGDGTNASSTFPVDISGFQFSQIDAGYRHTCAVDDVGDAYCWGANNAGQLGDGSFTGTNSPVPVSGGLSFSMVSAGNRHTCGLTTGNEIYCWGDGQFGQLGDGSGTFITTPVQIALAGPFSDVAAGGNHSCAVDTGGSAWCWGNNFSGQLGDGTNTQALTPVLVTPVAMRTFEQITAGDLNTCAVMDNGDAYCWGNGTTSGSGAPTTTNTPNLVIGGSTFVSLDAGEFHVCGVTNVPEVRCWGLGSFGELGDGGTATVNTPTTVPLGASTPVSVAAGGDHTCGLDDAGDAACWGRNSNGQLGNGTALTDSPQLVSTDTYTNLTSGTGHTCARNTTVGVIECWGEGSSGQLGNGFFNDASSPVTVSTGLGASAIDLDAGDTHTCAVRSSDNTGWCWGSNSGGQLGDGTFNSSSTPVSVAGAWIDISAGLAHTCALDTSFQMWCWGSNSDGQLGDGSTTLSSVPVRVWDPAGTGPWSQTFADISVGSFHTCAVAGTGDMYCWGFNGVGELGNGSSGSASSSSLPVLVSGGLTFQSVELGRQYSCATTATNAFYCWGGNGGGQHGNGSQISSTTPALGAGGQTFVTFGTSSGAFNGHSCGIDAVTIALYCFGNNQFGQVGDFTQTDQLSPVQVTAILAWTEVAPSRDHTCGLDDAGWAYCWGDNSQGYLGIGTVHRELTPVAVFQDNPFQVRAGGGVAQEPVKPRPEAGR